MSLVGRGNSRAAGLSERGVRVAIPFKERPAPGRRVWPEGLFVRRNRTAHMHLAADGGKRESDDMTVFTCRRGEHVVRLVSTKSRNIDMSG
jgi:hypothetical protein